MSTLWTPSGEHPIPRDPGPPGSDGDNPQSPDRSRPGRPAAPSGGEGNGPPPQSRGEGRRAGGLEEPYAPSPEEIRQAQQEMDAVRQELLRAPVELVISNHAMGLWELAALHLSERPPHLAEAQLAIDALSSLVEGLRGRLGEAEPALRDGLAEMRMAFVQIHNAEKARQGNGGA